MAGAASGGMAGPQWLPSNGRISLEKSGSVYQFTNHQGNGSGTVGQVD